MRKLLMTATMLTAICFAGATTALADGYNGHGNGGAYNGGHNNVDTNGGEGSQDDGYGNNNGYNTADHGNYGQGGGEQGYNGRDDDRRDRDWQRSWHRWDGYNDRDQVLPSWKLERRIERQGYFNVRNLHQSRFGYGWSAFARDRYGRNVALRINPHNGRVLEVRVLHRR